MPDIHFTTHNPFHTLAGSSAEGSGLDISAIHEDIRQVYKRHLYPWVIGYSGGKDSTAALQLIWNALSGLPVEERTRPIYVISSDTLVETPVIVGLIDDTLRRINETAERTGMPFTAHKLSPILADTFWVNLIGRGYPAPNSVFRWCTDRLKINPSNRFIKDKVAEHGEVILALGMRREESNKRDRVIRQYEMTGQRLARHGQLPGAWVYMPIERFSTDDVWSYLLSVPSPWGNDNRQLSALYKSAQGGECPLVVDDSTPSCGNSRFGCWVCTVVSRDRSMEAMIDGGEEWMIPLLEFRDWLAETQNPENKPGQREYRSRDGSIKVTDSGSLRWRTYTLSFSHEMLRRLLSAQKAVQEFDPNFVIITAEELKEIRRLWLTERQDWEDAVPTICRDVLRLDLDWEYNDVSRPGALELRLLDSIAPEHDVPTRLVQKLIDAEWQHYGMRRRPTIHRALNKILNEDWRSWDEVQQEMTDKQQEHARLNAPEVTTQITDGQRDLNFLETA